MRSYKGERDADGRPTIWVIEESPPPEAAEIAELLADLRSMTDPARHAPDWPEERARWMDRKHELLARIESSEHPTRRPLRHIEVHSPDGFEWGFNGNGPADLAHAVLADHLGVEPTTAVRLMFRDQIVAAFPQDRFYAPASLIGGWVAAHRDVIDREMFLTPPAGAERAMAVTETSGAPPGDGLDETDPATASQLVAACEAAWADIRTHHPDLPAAVVVLGTGIERGRLVKLGHWWGGQWLADGQARGEVLLAGEALHLEPAAVFEVLLHEAAHGMNAARGIKDTSRGGRYHNKHFATTAREALLRVRPMPPYGMAATELTPAARERYAPTIERLGEAMRIARQIRRGVRVGAGTEIEGAPGQGEGTGQTDTERKKDNGAAACACGRKLRMAPKTLAAGPVLCGLCRSEFQPITTRFADRDASASNERAHGVVDRSFLARRQTAIAANETDPDPLDEPVARILQSQHVRIEALIAAVPEANDPLQRSLALRRDRIESALVGIGPTAAARADDHEVLRHWYERWGTLDEQPMPASEPAEAARRERMARALLRVDGTLHGPSVTAVGGLELQAGDRVQAVDDYVDLPAGTLGTVEQVDPESGVVGIDFATWGRIHTTLEDSLLADLRHDYADVTSSGAVGPELDLPGMEP